MEIFIGKQLQVVVYSFVLGLIFGGLYDIIRIVHILCGIASYSGETAVMRRGKLPFLLFFLFDTAYVLTVIVVFSVFLYWQMNGIFRLFVLLSAVAGFAVYYGTAGRVVMFCSETIVRFLRLAVLWTVVKPARFVFGLLRRTFVFLGRQTVGRLVSWIRRRIWKIRSERIRRKFGKDICFAAVHKKEPT
ncbi:MAG: hypothetical protein ACI4V1_07745 [Eubacteriales bacterium]